MADTGCGATITFGTSTFTHNAIEIGGFTQERESVDIAHLGTTTYRDVMPGCLVTPGEFTVQFQYDPDVQPPITAAPETITLTYPIPSGKSAGATVAGTGFVKSWKSPDITIDGLMVGEYTVQWTGVTGPTFTDAT